MNGVPSAMADSDLDHGRAQLEFDDNLLLPLLYGERDQHLDRIERQLGVSLITRGNRLAISGSASATEAAHLALSHLYERLKSGQEVDLPAVERRFASPRPSCATRVSASGAKTRPFGPQAPHHATLARPGGLRQSAARQ